MTDTTLFCPYSLGDWMKACRVAGVPAVKAEQVAEIERHDFLSFDVPGPHQRRLELAMRKVWEARRDRGQYMFRWDPCAPSPLKTAMATAAVNTWEFLALPWPSDDPRAYEIIYDFPRFVVPVWRRPWVTAAKVRGYPIEFRAFVWDGVMQGISSYYPQRPLPDHDSRIAQFVDDVAMLTNRLIVTLKGCEFEWSRQQQFDLGCMPPKHRKSKRPPNSFTADFMVSPRLNKQGDVLHEILLFLEGGPPHERYSGAHPCCFPPGNIDGVALAPMDGAPMH